VVIDERGHGRSDKPQQGYAIKEMAADVVAVLDELKVNKAILVGNSIGGMIVMQLSLDALDRVAEKARFCLSGMGQRNSR
jgi:pimeloyl-ACP methyl ester carboxylesterase